MKLLLTSSGIDNRAIAGALEELVGKSPADTKIAFVPTSANAQPGNKDWLINSFFKMWRRGYTWIDLVDPSSAGFDWRARLDEADVIFIGGGNTFFLLDQARKNGFLEYLEANKDTKVFVGSSAGSILLTSDIGVAGTDYGDDNFLGMTDLKSLGWVDFELAPHYEQSIEASLAEYAGSIKNALYAIDDQSAIKVVDGDIDIISEGFWRKYN